MKKRNLKSLKLNKKSISNFKEIKEIKGGGERSFLFCDTWGFCETWGFCDTWIGCGDDK